MADVADQIFAAAQDVSTGKVQQGAADHVAGLVGKMQTIATQRAQIEEAKQRMEEAKLTKFVDALDKGKTFKGAARNNYYQKFMPRMRDSLGLTDKFPDESLAFMTADEENMNRVAHIVAQVNDGKMTGSRALELVNDPVKLAAVSGLPPQAFSSPLTPEEMLQITEAGKFAAGQRTEMAKNSATIGGAMDREKYNTSVKAEEAVADKLGKDYAHFTTTPGGGLANAMEKLNKLEASAKELDEGKVKTGTGVLSVVTGIPFTEARKVLSRTHPELKALMDDVEGAVNLKSALDSSFSDSAAAQVMARAFDPNLSSAQNAKKIRSVISELRNDFNIKMNEFDRAGVMSPKVRSEWMKMQESAPPQGDAQEQSQIQVIQKMMQSGTHEMVITQKLQALGVPDDKIKDRIRKAKMKGQ